jgi:hypothetical protein
VNIKHLAILAFFLVGLPLSDVRAAQILFTPELIVSEEYTDNIFLASKNAEDDYITTTGVNLTGQILSRTAGLELIYNPSYNMFANHTELNYWRHAGTARIWNDFQRNTRLELTDNYLETEDPRDESRYDRTDTTTAIPDIASDSDRQGRTRYRTNIAEARLSHQFGANETIYGGIQHGLHEEIEPPAGVTREDYEKIQPFVGLGYYFTPQFGVEIDGYFSNRNYADRNDREEYFGVGRLLYNFTRNLASYVEYRHTFLDYRENTDNDYHIYAPSIGGRYRFERNAQIRVSVGYYVQDFDNTDVDEEGWTVFSELNKRWDFQSTYIDLTGGSGYEIDDTGMVDHGLNIYYMGRLEVGYNFTARLLGAVFGGYRYDDFPDERPQRTDHAYNIGARIQYQILQWMRLGLTYNHRNVTSDIEAEEYTENSVIFTITVAPSAPFRLN